MSGEAEPTLEQALLSVMDEVAKVREAVKGYRYQLLADGFGPTAAERMAMELHHHMLAVMFAQVVAK